MECFDNFLLSGVQPPIPRVHSSAYATHPIPFEDFSNARNPTHADVSTMSNSDQCAKTYLISSTVNRPPMSLNDGAFMKESSIHTHDSLPTISPIPLFQSEDGDSYQFSVKLVGRDLCEHDRMYYVRQNSYISMGINFIDDRYDNSKLFVRITPSWDIQRPDSSTVIYCCNKHMDDPQNGDFFERRSMLAVRHPKSIYEIDSTTERLSVLVPMENKERSTFLWIPVKSKCFSTCGSTQKKPYHVVTVTLEYIDEKNRFVLGRKIFNMKFSSSPSRDMRKSSKNSNKRSRSTKTSDTEVCDGKRQAMERESQSLSDDSNSNSNTEHLQSDLIYVPVQRRNLDKVSSFIRSLEGDTAQNVVFDFQSINRTQVFLTSPNGNPSTANICYQVANSPNFAVETTPQLIQGSNVAGSYALGSPTSVNSSPSLNNNIDSPDFDLDAFLNPTSAVIQNVDFI